MSNNLELREGAILEHKDGSLYVLEKITEDGLIICATISEADPNFHGKYTKRNQDDLLEFCRVTGYINDSAPTVGRV